MPVWFDEVVQPLTPTPDDENMKGVFAQEQDVVGEGEKGSVGHSLPHGAHGRTHIASRGKAFEEAWPIAELNSVCPKVHRF